MNESVKEAAEVGYFPFFVELTGKRGLLVGGGPVALRKAGSLLDFGAKLTVVAPAFCAGFEKLTDVTLVKRPFAPDNLNEADFAVAATDDSVCNHQVALLCRERGIPVNSVDGREDSTFLFPALLCRGPLTVAISTGGASPAAAACLRAQIDHALPENLEDILLYLEQKRETLPGLLPEQGDRAALYAALYRACAAAGRPLNDHEEAALLAAFAKERGQCP